MVVAKRRRLLLEVRIHLDDVEGLGGTSSSRRAADGAGPGAEHAKVARLREELEIEDEALVGESYSDLLLDSPEELLRAAEEAMENAHAPLLELPRGRRCGRGRRIHVGSNVENASYPQGACAETSAIGALVAAGETQASPRWR